MNDEVRPWIELHITDGQKGRRPLVLSQVKKESLCPLCAGLNICRKYHGQAFCEQINTAAHNSQYGRDVHFFMDKTVTQIYCLHKGEGCPLRSEQKSPGFHAIFNRKSGW